MPLQITIIATFPDETDPIDIINKLGERIYDQEDFVPLGPYTLLEFDFTKED